VAQRCLIANPPASNKGRHPTAWQHTSLKTLDVVNKIGRKGTIFVANLREAGWPSDQQGGLRVSLMAPRMDLGPS